MDTDADGTAHATEQAVITLEEAAARRSPRAVAVGFFDGVHLGHQAILRTLVEESKSSRLLPACLTFEPHPLQVLEKGPGGPPMLTTLDEKVEIMRSMGVAECVVAPFTPGFARYSPERFARGVLDQMLDARVVLVGYNFTFGASARGRTEDLRRFGERFGFRVIVIDPVVVNDIPVSSTAIRGAVLRGDMESARAMLGRPYSLRGVVVHGDGRGRRLGIPTANMSVPPARLVPAAGVYATVAAWGGVRAPSVTNVGWRPTFRAAGAGVLSVETHIPGFNGDLYGITLELRFLSRLREEKRFDDRADLVEQVRADVKRALDICSIEPAEGGWPL